jgi:hypothetical protein
MTLARVRMAILALIACAAAFAGATASQAQGPDYNVPIPYLTPIPVVRLAGELTHAGVRVNVLRVKAPRKSKVTLRCSGGRKKGCTFSSLTVTAPKNGKVTFKKVERALRAGVKLKVFVRRGQTIGKYTRFTVRKGKAPSRSDACHFPGDPYEPRSCP